MALPSQSASKTKPGRASWWRVLTDATQSMRQAETPVAVMQCLARHLGEIGFQVIIGELNSTMTALRVIYIAPGMAAEDNRQASLAPPEPVIAPAALGIFPALLEARSPEIITLDRRALRDVLGTHAYNAFAPQRPPADGASLSAIVASPYPKMEDAESYVIWVTADDLSPEAVSLVAALTEVATALLENQALRREIETQQKNARSLREVSKIVTSVSRNLDPDTILISILEELSRVIPYDSAAVSLEEDGFLKLEAGRGFEQIDEVIGIVVPAHDNPLYQEMKRTQRPIVISDVRHDPRYTFWAGTKPIRSWIGVPLILHNEIIGQISIDSFRENAFKAEDGDLAFAFAQYVATAIQNARLFDEISRTADELRALLDGARDVSSSLRTERVIYLMADRLKNLMAATVIVYLSEGDEQALTPVVFLEMTLDQLSETVVRMAKTIAGQAMAVKQGVIVNALSDLAGAPTHGDPAPITLMAAPFIVQDRAIGAITLIRDEGPQFAQEGLDLLTRFALQTGIAIDNSRLYEQLSRRLERENLINALSRQMSSKLSLNRLANDVMHTAQQVSGAEVAGLILKDPTNNGAYLRYRRDINGLNIQKQSSVIPGLAALTMEKRQPILTHDCSQEPYAHQPWVPETIQGAIAIPISTGDQVLGALGVFRVVGTFAHLNEVLTTLEYIGRQASVAIENALLFQQVNEYAYTLEEKVKERTAEIQKQKEQTDAILESAADAICITSARGVIEYVNPAFTCLTGYTTAEIVQQSFAILVSEKTEPQKIDQMWNTIFAGKTWRGDVKNRRKDDSLYDADLTIAPIFGAEGQVDKFVAIQRDISKKTELDRLKTEFLVTASHELRTPLTTVTGYAELLLNRQFSPSETEHFLRYIYDQSKHLSNLVSDLLDVSRIEAGATFVLSPQLIEPGSVFSQLVEQWQETSPNHDITLAPPDTWPNIRADPDRLKQILNNLLSNAVKYSPQGGAVTVSVRRNLTNLLVSVADQGIGMTLDEQQYLFEKFWRADAGRLAVEGTGLGMVIVKHLIEAHGGKIWVTSQRGKGTTINFTLPLVNGVSTILIIEDDAQILELEENLLQAAGYHVITAQSGREGLALAMSEYPDLIILDLMLPEIEGEDVLHKLKNTPTTKNIPVVVVSAKAALFNIEYTFTLGAADFLTKPFDYDEFIGRIKIALLNKPP